MANCKYHDLEAVSECVICKAKLCKSCDDFQKQFGRCPKCAKKSVYHLHQNLKRGLIQNIISVICAVAFFSLFVVYICLGKASTTFIVVGAIIVALLCPLTIFMLIYNLKNIKRLKHFLDVAEDKKVENLTKNNVKENVSDDLKYKFENESKKNEIKF